MTRIFYPVVLYLCFLLVFPCTSVRAQMPSSGAVTCREDLTVSVAFSGATRISTCTSDSINDRIRFQVKPFAQATAYVVVDRNDIIQWIDFSNFINFDLLPTGRLRVYAFSNYGHITAKVGDDFNTTALSRPCFGLSDNFVIVDNGRVGETRIGTTDNPILDSLAIDSLITYDFCTGDGIPDTLRLTSVSNAQDVIYLVTDTSGVIVAIDSNGIIDFDTTGAGPGLLYAFAFNDSTDVAVGDTVSLLPDANACTGGLSLNFVTINRTAVNGGQVSVAGGGNSVSVCPQDGRADLVTFARSNAIGSNFTFIVTNSSNEIVSIPSGATIDFDGFPLGTCRVYSLSYEGTLMAEIGDDLDEAILSDDCFQLSSNFVRVVRTRPTAGTIATIDGADEVVTCPGDGRPDLISAELTGATGGEIAYALTNGSGVILDISTTPTFDLDGAGTGNCRIYGIVYRGTLNTDASGALADADLASECFEITDDFINVIRDVPEGGTVAGNSGRTEFEICPGDDINDVIDFTSSGADGESFIFLVTDTDNVILSLSEDGTIDFNDAPFGTCRVWGLSYRGELLAEIGDDLDEDLLAEGCSGLSTNYATVIRRDVVGGRVTTTDGETSIEICPQDGNPDLVSFQTVGANGSNTAYIVTDVNNVVIGLPDGNTVDFNDAPIGTCRVWSLSYDGELTVSIGEAVADSELASGCNDLSDNFVEVIRTRPEPGTIATTEGETEVRTCPGDGADDIISVTVSGATGGTVAYVITDANGNILSVSADGTFNVEGDGVGNSRIYGISYRGELNLDATGSITAADLASDCFEVTDNFVNVIREVAMGGTVATTDGENEVNLCPGDGISDVISFVSNGATGGNFVFIITDASNRIIGLPDGNSVDFDGAGTGICRLWGLTYQGELTAEIGDNIDTDVLATSCFDLSDNFVTVNRNNVDGGRITTTDGETSVEICPQDDNADVIEFTTTGAQGSNLAYIVTDVNNVVISLPSGNAVDFNSAPIGTCRVWSLTYEGELLIMIGEAVADSELASGCNDLSDNFVEINRTRPEAGSITTTDGETQVNTCPGDGVDDIISVTVDGAEGGNLAYVITDGNGNILDISTTGSFNVDGAGEGNCRIYGVTYRGELNAQATGAIGSADLASDCFEITDNFVNVIREIAVGGTVSTEDGATEVETCPGDGVSNRITFVRSGASGGNFVFIVTDANNRIIGLPDGNTIDFDAINAGVSRLWSLTYQGDLTAELGDVITSADLATSCFSLSENFVTVRRLSVDGGQIATSDGETEVEICPQDGNPDIIRFVANGVLGSNQVWIITDSNNVVLRVPSGNPVDFDDSPVGICRIWSLAYQGDLLVNVGDDLDDGMLASGCHDLSDNFVTINRTRPVAGTIVTTDGSTRVGICPGEGTMDAVSTIVAGASGGEVAYVLTDGTGIILSINTNGTFSPADYQGPAFRIYGLTYRGTLNVDADGAIETADLATSCFELTGGFITIDLEKAVGGMVTTQGGETEVTTCPNDGIADEFTFVSSGATNGEFIFIITNENNEVISLPGGSTVDFEDAGQGICRVWGLSYQGDLQVELGDVITDATLASGCYGLSENFVTINRTAVEGGRITTADGETSVEVCAQDGNPDVIEFTTTGATGSNLAYIVTDVNNVIIALPEGNTFDFDNSPVGICRVWALSYEGELDAMIGEAVADSRLATGCNSLSDNFVEINRSRPVAGTIATTDGETEVDACAGDGTDEITVELTGATGGSLAYAITDSDGIIISITDNPSISLEAAGDGESRIYGIVYRGELNTSASGLITTADLATECFTITDNFISLSRQTLDGGTVFIEAAGDEITICPNDGVDDILTFIAQGATGDNYTFIITDTNGIVLAIPFGETVDFTGIELGICRAYGLAYTGTLLVERGDNIATGQLASGCSDLSSNFATVIRRDAETGPISTEDGETTVFACVGDRIPDLIRFDSTGTTQERFNYLVTDTNNVVINVAFTDRIDFERYPAGVCRVYGLGYSGIVIARPGDIAGVDQLASECYALSPNFVTVIKEVPEAGTIATTDGSDRVNVCPMDGIPDIFEVELTGASTSAPAYIVTDTNDVILNIQTSPNFDFDSSVLGICRIYGLAYQGDILAMAGDTLFVTQLTEACFDLTDNYITVVREEVMGGNISLVGGATEVSICPVDAANSVLDFVSMDATGPSFQYVVTDTNNVVLSVSDDASLDFSSAGVGLCRVWGVSYAGESLVDAGDVLTEIDLATGCSMLTDNYVTVIREIPVAGTISLSDGSNELNICAGDAMADSLAFTTTGSTGRIAYLIVEDSTILGVVDSSNFFDFNNVLGGSYEVYALAYSGSLNVEIGGNPFSDVLASSCFQLTENSVTVSVTEVDGGTISSGGFEAVYLCPENMDDGLVNFSTTSTLADSNYVYVITTTTNVILQVAQGSSFNFNAVPLQELRVYAISYTGDFLGGPGSSLEFSPLATGCAGISSNFISVINVSPEAGSISTEVDQTGISCTVDGDPNLVVLPMGNSRAGYAIIVTDTAGIVQLVSLDPSQVPLGNLPEGAYRLYGLSYTGNVTVQPGQNINTAVLADNCFELTSEFVTVTQGGSIDAGTIMNLTNASDTVAFCTATLDGPQLVVVESDVTGPNYRYLITDEDGRILVADLTSTVIVLDPIRGNEFRIYGYNYTGQQRALFGRNINTEPLSDSCYAVTENFVTVLRVEPDGGVITTSESQTRVELSIPDTEDPSAPLTFRTTSDSLYQFVYVITDSLNIITGFSDTATIDFAELGEGTYLIWGLEYTGELLAEVGQSVLFNEFSDDCYDISDNFVTVIATEADGLQVFQPEDGLANEQDTAEEATLLLSAYPNPSAGSEIKLTIESDQMLPEGRVIVRDLNGKAYKVKTLLGGTYSEQVNLDVSMLPPGIYFVQYRTAAGNHSLRFVKQ